MPGAVDAMGAITLVIVAAVLSLHISQATRHYVLTLPKTLRSGAEETFCITLTSAEDTTFSYTLRLTHKDSQEEHDFEYEINAVYSQCNKFMVPSETGTYGVVLLNGTEDVISSGRTEVKVKAKNLITLVQTDKPIYKPGQKVQFRVLALTRDLMTKNGQIESIFIKNPNDIRVKQWLGVDLNGMASFQYQMPSEPQKGDWSIDVTIDSETTTQTFRVDEYVLPRFEVKVKPPAFLLANTSTIEGTVCAEYTYGKPVNGDVTLQICLTSYGSSGRPCYRSTNEIEGCYKFSVNTSEVEMENTYYYLYGSKLQISATVTETNTGVVVNKTISGPTVTYDPLNIVLEDDTNGYFKPVFPYHGRAKVMTPDNTPAVDELIQITIIDYRNDIRLANNYTTDKNGYVHFSICSSITEKTEDFQIEAQGILYSEPTTYYGLSNALYMPRAHKSVKQWYSPSRSYIAIPKQTGVVPCGDSLELTIPYSTTLNSFTQFHYQIMSRGRIVHSGKKIHHAVKHESTEFLSVPMMTCLQEVPTPSPPSFREGAEQGEAAVFEKPIHAESYEPLGVRKRRAAENGELGILREGEKQSTTSEMSPSGKHEHDRDTFQLQNETEFSHNTSNFISNEGKTLTPGKDTKLINHTSSPVSNESTNPIDNATGLNQEMHRDQTNDDEPDVPLAEMLTINGSSGGHTTDGVTDANMGRTTVPHEDQTNEEETSNSSLVQKNHNTLHTTPINRANSSDRYSDVTQSGNTGTTDPPLDTAPEALYLPNKDQLTNTSIQRKVLNNETADNTSNSDSSIKSQTPYDDDDDDDDIYNDDDEYYEEELEDETRDKNTIKMSLFGEEPISAAIFEPFGLRRKRSLTRDTEQETEEPESRTEFEGENTEGEEAPRTTIPPTPPAPARHVSHFTVSLPITEEMSPSANVLVFYVRDDGETVADSIDVQVESCFKNKVKMDFTQSKVVPGRDATLHLEADPGSLCSIGVVDKSVSILAGDHQLTPDKIVKRYEQEDDFYSYQNDDTEYCQQKVQKDEEAQKEQDIYRFWHYSSRYVDAIEAFRQIGMAVSSNLILETRPCSKEYPVYDDVDMAGESLPGPEGVFPQPLPIGINYQTKKKKTTPGSSTRSFFPETWLWDLAEIGDSGEVDIRRATPHTITEWFGNSICTNPTSGLGVSSMTSVTTFQPFFLAINLPYAAVRGERLPIHVTVYNYLDKCLYMQINLDSGDSISATIRSHLKLPFCLCGEKSKTHSYYISPQDVGKLPVIAVAEIVPGTCDNSVETDTDYVGLKDAVKRELFVQVEGVTQEYTKSLYICSKDNSVQQREVELPLPKDIVPDSARGHISVIGDIMGPALSNLDSLVQLPTGCGEQTMVAFTPNIYVLRYLTFTHQLTEDMKILTERYMEMGYTRELNYRHDDGSFSAFGQNDAGGSTWLTAFVVKSFAQARRFIYIDQDNIDQGVKFLKSTRLENGCFREQGKVIGSYMMGGLGKVEDTDDTALTAFVITALLEAYTPKSDTVLQGALNCLCMQPLDEMDTYTLTLVSYALVLHNSSSECSHKTMVELNNRVISDGTLSYWGRSGTKPESVSTWHYKTAPSAEIEMTSYGLLSTLLYYQEEAVTRGQPITMWLSQQRNGFGGFASTQDTVLGLQALSEFASKTFTGNDTDLTVHLGGNNFNQSYDVITGLNSLLLQQFPIRELPDTLRLQVNGTGCALIQANVQFNKLVDNAGTDGQLFHLSIALKRSQHRRDDCARRSLAFCIRYIGPRDVSVGMSMMTVKMVTGWSPVQDSLTELKVIFPVLGMKKFENDIEKGLIAFYFDELHTRKRCFKLEVEQDRDLAVTDPKPAEVQVYQYYEKEIITTKTYKIKTTCGTKAEIPKAKTRARHPPGPPIPVQTRLRDNSFVPLQTAQAPRIGCPVCLDESPENFEHIVCKSKSIFKVLAGRTGKAPIKVKADLRPRKKIRIDKFAHFAMEPGCRCDLLNPPMRRLLILSKRLTTMTKKDSVNDDTIAHVIHLDRNVTLINLDKNRKLERETRKITKRCKVKVTTQPAV